MAKKESVLSRFGDIMAANMHALLDKCEDPAKMVDQQLRKLRDSLADVQEATAEVMANEAQCRRVVDDYNKKMAAYEETAKKALRAGNESDARVMIEKKQALAADKANAEKALELATANADRMRKMHDKLANDIAICDSKRASIKATAQMAKAQEKVNDSMERLSRGVTATDAFGRLEDKVNSQLDKATARASLIAGEEDPVAAIEAKYAGASASSVEDELSALKASMGV